MNPKILLVEDDSSIQRLYERALLGAGFQLALSVDGSDIVNKVLTENPNLILMDVMMPVRNGIDALKDLKADQRTSKIPVILLSAYEDDELLFRGMQEGASRYLIKGKLEMAEVIRLIRETLDKYNSQNSNQTS